MSPLSIIKLFRTFEKFKWIQNFENPSFENDYDCVNYALYILGRSFAFFPNDLEENSDELVKSSMHSENIRDLGNDMYRAGNMLEAVNLYTLSIAYARTGSKELALAYGNRSAVLFKKQYYKECLEDIQRALENNYPSEKKSKLILRQTRAKELLSDQKKIYHDTIPTIKKRNPNMPSASDCITINKDQEFGRHIVASRTINPGEILLVEKPYSLCVFKDNRITYCSECFQVCYNMIPCEKCAGALYCSRSCRRKAYMDYHRYECAILLYFGYDVIDWTATRLSLKCLKEYYEEPTNRNLYLSDRYKEISELITHKDSINEIMSIGTSIGVAKVFYALKNFTDIFSEFDIENNENILKSLLLTNAYIRQFNAVLVTDICINPLLSSLEVTETRLGVALYSVLSMFNHACIENVGHSFHGSTVVLRAKKQIRKGEQCFINYMANEAQTKKERQSCLQQLYNFTCKCQACNQNWPKEEVVSGQIEHLLNGVAFLQLEVLFDNNMTNDKKKSLFQRSFRIAKKIEQEAPCLAYNMLMTLYNYIWAQRSASVYF